MAPPIPPSAPNPEVASASPRMPAVLTGRPSSDIAVCAGTHTL